LLDPEAHRDPGGGVRRGEGDAAPVDGETGISLGGERNGPEASGEQQDSTHVGNSGSWDFVTKP
jgi:hypothetical protein